MRSGRRTAPARGWRSARGSVAAAILLTALWASLPGAVDAATVQAPDTPISLSGEGTDYAEIVLRTLDSSASTSEAAPRFDYIGSNEAEGLRAFVEGRTDFYVGALPLDEVQPGATDELKKGGGVISAPFQATGAVPFMSGPYGTGLRICDPGSVLDPETFDTVCPQPVTSLSAVRRGTAGDSLRLYPENIVQLFSQSTPSDLWFEPSFRSQADPAGCRTDDAGECVQRIEAPGVPGPVSGVRTDSAAINKFLQQYLKDEDPVAFRSRVLADLPDDQRDGYVITPRWPRSAQASRSPDSGLANAVQTWTNFQSSEIPKGGSIAFVHPLKAVNAIAAEEKDALEVPPKPVTDLWIADFVSDGEVRSGTPQAITKAVAAGGETPFFAATTPVPGAWPFSWVDRIYLPERGLSVDQTNAAALMLRLQMTAGQVVAAGIYDGQLTRAMVLEGLAAANKVVESNCAAAKGVVVKEKGAGPFTPATLGPVMEALGTVPWCQATAATPPPAADTTPLPVGVSPSDLTAGYGDYGSYPYDSSGYTPLGESYDAAGGGGGTGGAAGGADGPAAEKDVDDSVEEIAAEMPLELPGKGSRGMDRIATVALGAALFFAARAIWRAGSLQRLIGLSS